jgi:DNA-binding GntR family transcriptional regulator
MSARKRGADVPASGVVLSAFHLDRGMRRSADNKEIVFQALRERIASHQLPPGSRLSEQQLVEEFRVSRAVVREAFIKLEQRGLITRSHKKSVTVVRLELNQVFEIYAVREILEGLCARLAAQNVPKESWQDLVDLFDAPMEEVVKRGDLETYITSIQTLRMRMIAAANSPTLAGMLDLINDKVSEIARRIIILPGRVQQGLQEHRAILQALRRGDPEESERLRRENIRSSAEYLSRYKRFLL